MQMIHQKPLLEFVQLKISGLKYVLLGKQTNKKSKTST